MRSNLRIVMVFLWTSVNGYPFMVRVLEIAMQTILDPTFDDVELPIIAGSALRRRQPRSNRFTDPHVWHRLCLFNIMAKAGSVYCLSLSRPI